MGIDITRPKKLYRYSERKWLERSLVLGEFRLRPASEYQSVEKDTARQDDELVRTHKSPASSVTIKNLSTGEKIQPIGDVTYRSEINTNYLTICFSQQWDEKLFEAFPDTDACLVVHHVEEFCERIHRAVERLLPQWIGMDASVEYFGESQLGVVFSKPRHFFYQHEWRFAWVPRPPNIYLEPITIKIGSIENIAEVIGRTLQV